jgi:hypothetical protein
MDYEGVRGTKRCELEQSRGSLGPCDSNFNVARARRPCAFVHIKLANYY